MKKFFYSKLTTMFYIVITSWLVSTNIYSKEANNARLNVGSFSLGLLNGWQSKSLEGETDYQIIRLDGNKVLNKVLKADSNKTASGIYYKKTSICKKHLFSTGADGLITD